jgi:hypothetical protein
VKDRSNVTGFAGCELTSEEEPRGRVNHAVAAGKRTVKKVPVDQTVLRPRVRFFGSA